MKVAAVSDCGCGRFPSPSERTRADSRQSNAGSRQQDVFTCDPLGMAQRQPLPWHRAQSGGKAPPIPIRRRIVTRSLKPLAKLDDVSAANAVRLLLLTGARRGELLAAKWADIDLEDRRLDQARGDDQAEDIAPYSIIGGGVWAAGRDAKKGRTATGSSPLVAEDVERTSTAHGSRFARPLVFPTRGYTI